MSELESKAEIAQAAKALLRRADALGRLPTPVDDLVAAARLTEPDESLLATSVLQLAPAHLRDAVARLGGRVRGLVDRRAREVHLAPDITHEGRRNFIRLHETGHDILPWQRDLAYADDDASLSPATHDLFELEASQCAAELMFQGSRFTSDAADVAIGISSVILSAQRYGSSIRAGLRRYTETHRAEMVSVVLDVSAESLEPLTFRRHELSRSRAYAERFGDGYWPGRLTVDRFAFLAVAAAAAATPKTVAAGEWSFVDLSGRPVVFRVDALSTGYDLLVLAWVPIAERTRRRVQLIGSSDVPRDYPAASAAGESIRA